MYYQNTKELPPRLLSHEEALDITNCIKYTQTPPGSCYYQLIISFDQIMSYEVSGNNIIGVMKRRNYLNTCILFQGNLINGKTKWNRTGR